MNEASSFRMTFFDIMKLNITPTFAVMLKTLARQNNAEPDEYIEELILSEYQKKRFQERI